MDFTKIKELGIRIIDNKKLETVYFEEYFSDRYIKIFNFSKINKEFKVQEYRELLIGESVYNKYNILVGNIINIKDNIIQLDKIETSITEYIIIKKKSVKYFIKRNDKYIEVYPLNSNVLKTFYIKNDNEDNNTFVSNKINDQISDVNIVLLFLIFVYSFVFGSHIYKFYLHNL